MVYCQYKNWLDEADAAMAAAGTLEALKFTPSGTAGIFGLYVMPGSKLGQVFLNEFVSVRHSVAFSCYNFRLFARTSFLL